MIDSCLQEHPDGTVLSLQVQPRAGKNQVVGMHNGSLKVKLTSPPVDGAANKNCCAFIGKLLGVAKSNIVIISGESSRHKRVLVKSGVLAEIRHAIEVVLK